MFNNLTKLGVAYVLRCNLTSKVMSRIKTFVFLDLETTGLPQNEHNKTKITELCAVAVQADHIELGCFPRVHNKLSFCFNPKKMIHPESTDITGLSNELLEHQVTFGPEIVNVLVKWLETSQKPLCFVAHNGDRFDYPILRAEVAATGCNLPEDILCVDSLTAFKAIDQHHIPEGKEEEVPFEFNDDYDEILCRISEEYEEKNLTPEEVQKINETTPKKQIISVEARVEGCVKKQVRRKIHKSLSYKLQDVYARLTNKKPLSAHEAEADVLMLITCAAVLGEKFVAYANDNSKSLTAVPPMKPGKRIGT